MNKVNGKRINERKEETINACEELYKTKNFKDISLKDIGNITSISRTSIYNYFETKEEIFLALLKREYDLWINSLKEVVNTYEFLNNDQIADILATTLSERKQLLKLLSMNIYDLEENSRLEHLIDFKISYGNSLKAVEELLIKFRKDMTKEDRNEFLYSFFPFMFGIYPYTFVTNKQIEAMKKANVNYVYNSLHDFIYKAAKKMLNQ